MSASELRDKTPDQLQEDLANLKKESFNLRFQQATGQLENTAGIRKAAALPPASKPYSTKNPQPRPVPQPRPKKSSLKICRNAS